jgi:hypothetical protein
MTSSSSSHLLRLFIEQVIAKESMGISTGGGALQAGGKVSGTGMSGDMEKSHKKLWSGDEPEKKTVKKEGSSSLSSFDAASGGTDGHPIINTRKPMFSKEVERITNLALYGETDDEILQALGDVVDGVTITPRWVKFVASTARKGLTEYFSLVREDGSLFQGPKDVAPAEDDINAPKDYPAFGGDPNMIQGMMGTDSHYNYPPAHLNPELVNSLAGDTDQFGNPKRRGRTVADRLTEQQQGNNQEFFYHATNEQNLSSMIEAGSMIPFKPWYGTDQETWPDGSVQSRIYFGTSPHKVEPFYPSEGKRVLLRVPAFAARFKSEGSTGDWFATKPIPNHFVEFFNQKTNQWEPIMDNQKKNDSDKQQLSFKLSEKSNVLDKMGDTKAPSFRSPYGQTYLQKDDPEKSREMGILGKVKKNLDKKAYTLHDPPSMGISITNPKLKDRKNK